MRKITIEYDETDSLRDAMVATNQAIRDNANAMKPDQNIKITWEKGLKAGLISQRGKYIGLIRRGL